MNIWIKINIMVFYFTGTGNSLFAAKALAGEEEKVVSMIEATRSKAFPSSRAVSVQDSLLQS